MTSCITRIGLRGVALLVVLGLSSSPVQATNYWKNSVITGNWSNGNNWASTSGGVDNAGTPTSNEAVNIVFTDDTARTVTYEFASPSLGLLTIDLTGAGATTATLSLTVNNLTTNGIIVGGYSGAALTNGRGTIIQSAGTTTTSAGQDLILAYGSGSTGAYTLSGGALVNNLDEYVGFSGTGTFNHSGGSNTINASASGFFSVGQNAGSTGTYNLSGTGALVANTSEYIGYTGTGSFTQSGGTNTINGYGHHLYLGFSAGGSGGTYTLNSGALLMNQGNEFVGFNAMGTFNQTGGTNTLTGENGSLFVSSGGTYTLSGGDLLANSSHEYIGYSGIGTFNQTGGTNTCQNSLFMGMTTNSTGTYTLTAGALSTLNQFVGYDGTATINQSGGTNTTGGLNLGVQTGGTGTYNLSGGSVSIGSLLYVGGEFAPGGTGVLNVSGTGNLTVGTAFHVRNSAGNAVNLSGGTINSPALNFNGNPSRLNWTGGKLHLTQSVTWDSAAGATSTGAAFGSSRTLGNNQTLMITGNETLGGAGAFALTLNNGSTHNVSGGITLSPTGTITQNTGSTLSYSTFTQAGGTVNGTLQNETSFIYQGGVFSGRLVNYGAFSFGTSFTAGNGIENHTPMTVAAGQTLTANGAGLDSQSEFIVNGSVTATTFSNSALLHGIGQVTTAVTNTASGDVRVATGERLRFAGVSFTNQGLVEVIGNATSPAEIEFNSPVTNGSSTGLITGRNNVLRFNGGLTNEGSLAVSIGTSDVFGDISNAATGKIVVSGGAGTTFYDDIVQNGTFRVTKVGSTTSVAVVFGAFSGSGGSTGGGDIFFEGDLRPGNSPARVVYENNVSFGSSTLLQMELGGTSLGTQYDQVHVDGELALGGTLKVELIDLGAGLFAPAAGDSFDILDWQALSGTFSAIQLPTLAGALAWNTSQLYTTGVLSVVAPGVPGDYSNNGVVDAADYVMWRKGGPLANEVDTPGTVNAADYTAWRARFGNPTSGYGAGANANATVPEPATWVLLFAGMLSICSRHRAAVS